MLEILFFLYFLIFLTGTLIFKPSISLNFEMRIFNEIFFKIHYVVLILVILKIEKINLKQLNFNFKNKKILIKSINIGLTSCLIPLILNLDILFKFKCISINDLIWCNIYNLLIVAFFEEFLFRGFLQNFCNRICSNKFIAILLGSLFFSIAHLPVNILIQHNSILDLILSSLGYMFMHIILYIVSSFSKNLISSTILHGFINILSNIRYM